MDQGFLRRAERLLARSEPATLDHDLLVAAVAARQATSATVKRAGAPSSSDQPTCPDPFVTVLLGEKGWPQAARLQRGCFSRAETERGRNGS